MASFEVYGPYEITYEARPGGRTLVFDDFWADGSAAADLAGERGCYVFAISAGGGLQPIYVGKATKTFKQETFNATNRHKFHNGFSGYAKGRPVMYFVVHPSQRGPTNARHIGEIEVFLIQAGVAKNPDLQNVKGVGTPAWSIKGVIRSGVGKRNAAEVEFRKLFDLGE
jgi:hypothetical protein